MAYATAGHVLAGMGRLLEHATAVALGLVMMIVGLGLGVTVIMLPAGLVIGLLGVAIVVSGIFARVESPHGR